MIDSQIGNWTNLPQLVQSNLTEKINLEQYRAIMSYPVWNFVHRAIVDTRSYEDGLSSGTIFIHLTEGFRARLDQKEYESNMIKLHSLILNMLDRLDRWEEYLEIYEYMRKHCLFCLTYSKDSKQIHGEVFEQFIISEGTRTSNVHFLWGVHHRRDLIEKKLHKKRAGQKLGNQFHARQSELSAEEIDKRLAWIMKTAEYAKKFGSRMRSL